MNPSRCVNLLLIVWLCCFAGGVATAQSPAKQYKWWLELRDKPAESPWSVQRPQEFLSARSIARRQRNHIPTTEEDLPVYPPYLQALRQQGFAIHGASRWLNGVAIIADSSTAQRAGALPFVKSVTNIGRDIRIKNPPNRPEKKRNPFPLPEQVSDRFGPMGYGVVNAAAINVPFLNQIQAKGRGIWVAVMDGGFTNVDTMPFFDSLAVNGRLWPGPDFVEHDRAVYESAQHGTAVLSVMGANLPGYFVGTAPDATYFLLKTEDTGGEYPVEEINWILGAEWADSIGVDIINASLGYTTFSEPAYNRPYSALNGKTALGSKGAAIAAQKGMIICNSAGNSGDEPWHFIGVPADAPGIIAVGAIDAQTEQHASFSSYGPTADGRIKPDLMAPGQTVVTAGNVGDQLTMSAGTSIASPILTGAIAALWSDFPDHTAAEITDALYRSADRYTSPDTMMGYGTPNVARAWLHLQHATIPFSAGYYGYNSDTDVLTCVIPGREEEAESIFFIKNIFGQTVAEGRAIVKGDGFKVLKINNLEKLPSGFYQIILPFGLLRFGK